MVPQGASWESGDSRHSCARGECKWQNEHARLSTMARPRCCSAAVLAAPEGQAPVLRRSSTCCRLKGTSVGHGAHLPAQLTEERHVVCRTHIKHQHAAAPLTFQTMPCAIQTQHAAALLTSSSSSSRAIEARMASSALLVRPFTAGSTAFCQNNSGRRGHPSG